MLKHQIVRATARRVRQPGSVRPWSEHQRRAVSSTGPAPNMQVLSESFASGQSMQYIEDMYDAWKKNPASVLPGWQSFFQSVDRGVAPGNAAQLPPAAGAQTGFVPGQARAVGDAVGLVSLITEYRNHGHRVSTIDPLGRLNKEPVAELELAFHGFSEADLDRPLAVNAKLVPAYLQGATTLRGVVEQLRAAYCGNLTAQLAHVDAKERAWLEAKLVQKPKPTAEERLAFFRRLTWADKFERFLGTKYKQDKRFGLEGQESLIPGMEAMIDRAAELGVENIQIGMPHRGRLNVLANVLNKPLKKIFSEFDKTLGAADDEARYTSDVKYHLGATYDRPTLSGKRVHVELLANPSHLEAVNPVVEGKVAALQHFSGDTERKKTVSLALHGDAAFAGQGVVYETVQMTGLQNYTTGGTIHVVVNNQVGFTTNPSDSRSTMYCTDLAKTFGAPVLHVNSRDSENVAFAFKTAIEFRQEFGRDVYIDLVGYRVEGHNEQDEPRYTQPLMYAQIKAIEEAASTLALYKSQLLAEGVLKAEDDSRVNSDTNQSFDEHYAEANKGYKPEPPQSLNMQASALPSTGVPLEQLTKLGKVLTTLPAGFVPHELIVKFVENKEKLLAKGQVDWGTGEAFAFGTLLSEGYHVRLSGQDAQRGTFSHRHGVLHDQKTEKTYVPLANVSPTQAKVVLSNSHLSEFGVLGFELGYSLASRKQLNIWEAQFGDFANTAQAMIDQFIASGESKWGTETGLTLLLPHSYDGSGPEHSSARLERFLQLSDDTPFFSESKAADKLAQLKRTNLIVANVTTPANLFHLLRRQAVGAMRKPLIVMSPKHLLRHPLVKSDLKEFAPGTAFQEVYGDTGLTTPPDKVRKVLFCSGRVYYDLVERRTKDLVKDVALIRVEQIAPFPWLAIKQQRALYPNATVHWCQEEHMNAGAYTFVQPRFHQLFGYGNYYIGRAISASTACGKPAEHARQFERLLQDALFR